VAVKGPADIWTTLVASREPAILARRLVDNPRTLTSLAIRRSPRAQPVRLERTPRVQGPMLHVEASPVVQIAPRVRDDDGIRRASPRSRARYLWLGSTPSDTTERVVIDAGTALEHLTKACLASRSPVRQHRSGCARLQGTGARRRSATNRLRIHLPLRLRRRKDDPPKIFAGPGS
jgi:hypothetical protein